MHHRRSALTLRAAVIAASILTLAGQGCTRRSAAHVPAAPTFARDVAPILYRSCAPCHHPTGPGPFPLLTFDDARKRARQIVKVTTSRYMPPWPPEPGHGRFVGERRLTETEIAILSAWQEAGSPEGDRKALPSPPTFTRGWQLGAPDLVLTPPGYFTLPAEGADIFWNVVLPAGCGSDAIRTRDRDSPGQPAGRYIMPNVVLDRSGMGRALDAKTPGVGFPGMDIEVVSDTFEPDSHFLFWKPGTPPVPEPADMAWRLDPSTDLILNMHLQPSGRAGADHARRSVSISPTRHLRECRCCCSSNTTARSTSPAAMPRSP